MVDDPILLDRFFVLSAVNLFAFRVTIFVSEAATERKFHGDFVFWYGLLSICLVPIRSILILSMPFMVS